MKRKKGNKKSIITFYLFIYTDKLKFFFHPTHIHRQKKIFLVLRELHNKKKKVIQNVTIKRKNFTFY